MRRPLFLSAVLAVASGCALVAGLKDREPPDVEAGTADAAAGDERDEAAVPEAAPDVPDVPIPDAGPPRDAKADGSDGGVICGPTLASPGVACGASAVCPASEGCCRDGGACGDIVTCPGTHLSCDGPEDCASDNACCGSSTASLGITVCSQSCGVTICHTSCDCPDAAPACCPYAGEPRYRRCMPACN